MNLLDLVQQHSGGEYRKAGNKDGGEYHGPCPMCGDFSKPDSNRFHIWPEQNPDNEIPGSFWCRMCEKGGDAITFVMAADGLEYPQALKKLGIDRAYTQPVSPRVPGKKQPKPETPPTRPVTALDADTWRAKAETFVTWSAEKLQGNTKRLAWLKQRGLRQDTCRRFRLGWNVGKNGRDIFRPRESWGVETVMKGNRRKRLWLPRGLVIPLIGGSIQKVKRVRIRRFADTEPRYYVIPGSSMDMLAIPAADPRAVIVVESELDAMLVWQEAGDAVGVVAIGTSKARPDAAAMAVLKEAELIIHAMDADEAGEASFDWWRESFDSDGLKSIDRWPVPAGKDPGEAYQAGIDIRGWVMDALPPTWRKGKVQGSRFKVQGSKKASVRQAQDRSVGPLEKKTERGESVREEAAGGEAAEVRELIELLRKSPVRIHHTPERTYIREPQAWVAKHWDVSKRIAQLAYSEAGLQWLGGLGLEVVGARDLRGRG